MPESKVSFGPAGWALNRTELNELLLKPLFVSDNVLTSHFNIRRNVKDEVNLHFIGAPSRFVQPNQDCTFSPKGKLTLTSNTLKVSKHKVELEHCQDEFFDTCLERALTGSGNEIFNPDATPEMKQLKAAMMEQINAGIVNDLSALAWFADSANTIGDATLSAFYSQLATNGIFTQLDAKNPAVVKLVSAASGTQLSGALAVALLRGMYEQSGTIFRKLPKALREFKVTSSIYEPYKDYLRNLGALEQNIIVQEGFEALKYDGMAVVEMPDWDDTLKNDFGLSIPNRAILTASGNLAGGTDVSATGASLRWYSDIHGKSLYAQGYFRFGTGIVHDELVVYAK
jgi:hypothetical protein